MAETLIFNIAESVLGKLGSLALEQFFLAWGLESDLENIKKVLRAITAVILDAEQKQSRNHQIEVWLGELKDLLYDIEDVVDEFQFEALRRQVVKARSTCRKIRLFFSSSNPLVFHFRMAHKLKNIIAEVVRIADLKSNFGLTEGVSESKVIRRERETTHSFVDAATVIGRDQDKEQILEYLLKDIDVEQNSK